jgi:HD-GYP domain-containing protein (c-di-GMP phosphodiesterase class II)
MEFIDAQSTYTLGHTPRVVDYAVQIAARMNLTDAQIQDVEDAAWIHNIGLLNQTQSLENVPRVLSTDELKAARNHTVIGAEMIRPISFLSHLVPVVRYHHHPYDGSTGEPRQGAIPLGARIISIADAYRAMLEPRAYRPALTRKDALLEVVKESGRQFDPQLVPFIHELS